MEMETKLTEIEYDWITVNNDFETLMYVLYSKEILKKMNEFKEEDNFEGKNLEVIFNSVTKLYYLVSDLQNFSKLSTDSRHYSQS